MTTLETERLRLRPFRRADAAEFARLAGDWVVASMTSDIPHPFSAAEAVAWLKPVRGETRFAIEREGRLIGGVGFYRRSTGLGELGFWLGRAWWGRGYATEAGRAVLRQGFRDPRLPGFSSAHFVDNPASGRVLRKLGFAPEGRGIIACAARGCEVEALIYRLDRQQAAVSVPFLAGAAANHSRWRTWLARFGAA